MGRTAAARSMLSKANAISAAIRAVDGDQPASMCQSVDVHAALPLLGTGAWGGRRSPLGTAHGALASTAPLPPS